MLKKFALIPYSTYLQSFGKGQNKRAMGDIDQSVGESSSYNGSVKVGVGNGDGYKLNAINGEKFGTDMGGDDNNDGVRGGNDVGKNMRHGEGGNPSTLTY